ncbi:hypothetical protein [Mitsuaria sp. GD03876]|uniref:hypothetical protein n=1 Tax=Mitsuaria sp. GD03876 TaxID=2975399 RepID=UPI002447102F|nr:hypothetical protein [Mitsuaria sp. GD03876]MDH0865764.1 hypothetical protein [Mitsuaria sp. GD03876]
MPASRIVLASLMLATCGAALAAESIVARLPRYERDGQVRPWSLVDSRWGYLSRYNTALAQRLDQCPAADPSLAAMVRIAPERFGATTMDAMKALSTCTGAPSADPAALEAAYAQLLPQDEPTVPERARILYMRASPLTPDYDRSFWDMSGDGERRSADPDSLFTWGPFRATAGRGCTLQKVLKVLAADASLSPALHEALLPEQPLFAALMGARGCEDARQLLQPLASDPARRDRFQLIFAQLAEQPRARLIYDQFFYGPGGKRLGEVADYVAAWKAAGRATVTEIDFAFFVERSLQYPRLDRALVARFVKAVPADAKPWQVRKVASGIFNLTQPGSRSYLSGRDATYFIDGDDQLRQDRGALAGWIAQSRVRASDVGLSDRPFDICGAMPVCPGPQR